MHHFTTPQQYYLDFFDTLFPDTLSRALITEYNFSQDEEDSFTLEIKVDNTRTNQVPTLTFNPHGIHEFSNITETKERLRAFKTLQIKLKNPSLNNLVLKGDEEWDAINFS